MDFNMIGSNSSIKNYNKVFNQQMEAFNIGSDNNGMTAFDSVLQGEMQSKGSMPQGPIINSGIQMNVGLENMGVSPLERIDSTQGIERTSGNPKSAVEKTANEIGKAFGSGLNSVNEAQNNAYNAAETFASGGDISVHEVMLASQKANLSMQMALQLRNRMLNAYTELNNVRV